MAFTLYSIILGRKKETTHFFSRTVRVKMYAHTQIETNRRQGLTVALATLLIRIHTQDDWPL